MEINQNLSRKKITDPKYNRFVKDDVLDDLEEKIKDILIRKEKYKDPDYNAKKLADDCDTKMTRISIAFNSRFKMNYNMFVNKQRVDAIKRMLSDEKFDDMNIPEIAKLAGFKTIIPVFSAFKCFEGMTPFEYRKTHNPDRIKKRHEKKDAAAGKKKRGRKPKQQQ